MLCNTATFQDDPENYAKEIHQRECVGDASEVAIFRCMEATVGQVASYRLANEKICEVQFSSSNRYQFSIHRTNDNDPRYLIVMKGAPEKIIKSCSTIFVQNAEVDFNQYWKKEYQQAFKELSVS